MDVLLPIDVLQPQPIHMSPSHRDWRPRSDSLAHHETERTWFAPVPSDPASSKARATTWDDDATATVATSDAPAAGHSVTALSALEAAVSAPADHTEPGGRDGVPTAPLPRRKSSLPLLELSDPPAELTTLQLSVASKPLPELPPDSVDASVSLPSRRRASDSSARTAFYTLAPASKSAPALQASPSGSRQFAPPPLPDALDGTSIRLEKRYRALLELVETEEAYLQDLCALNEVYFPLLASASLGTEDARARIQRNTADLIALHQQIVASLAVVDSQRPWRIAEARVHERSDEAVLLAAEAICRVFSSQSVAFDVYAIFCALHSDAAALIARLAESRMDFEAYEVRCASMLGPRPAGAAKLRFLDYAIKPIQRICRYPLVLGYLLKTLDDGTPAYDAARQALEAMKTAAAAVDQARTARDIEVKTLMVARRMEMPPAVQPAFLSFLGHLELVGAMQFLHLTPTPNAETAGPILRVKYLGALLYPTHLVFVKVKKADCYEPRHWFPLRAVTLERVTEGDGLLAHSLRVVCNDHRFELGCATSAERDLWFDHLERTQGSATTAWIARVAEMSVDAPFDETSVSSVPVNVDDTPHATPVDNASMTLPPPMMHGRSRFHQMLGRTSAAMRDTVDLRLADVFSDACLTARYRLDASGPSGGRAMPPPSRSRSTPLHRRKSSGLLEFQSESRPVTESLQHQGRRLSLSSIPLLNFGHSASPSDASAEHASGSRSTAPAGRPWQGSWRRKRTTSNQDTLPTPEAQAHDETAMGRSAWSTASLPALTALAGPVVALVNRNGSTSSSGSSAPPSPGLATPTDSSSPRWFSMNTLSRKSQSAVSLPPFATLQQEEQAIAAADFLRTNEKRNWRDSWRAKQSYSSQSLLGIFKPTLSPTLASPTPAPITTFAEPEEAQLEFGARRRTQTAPMIPSTSSSSADSDSRASLGGRRKSIKLFRNLTMTRMSAGPLIG